jgi:hypothetical protein
MKHPARKLTHGRLARSGRFGHFVAVAVVAAFISAASVEAAGQRLVPRNGVGSAQIRNGAILPADLNKKTVAYLNAGAPSPRARGVTIANGVHGDRVRITAATISEGGDVLGQIEYLGGLSCPSLGPWPTAEATFFDASGLIVATGSDTKTSAVPGVRYPLRIYGASGAVRAEVVASVSCL